ncbi:hypothetical protein CAPTEDRAFT_203095 [Capitella teleta]|uniref:EF-hand domain-containing protein n=1 Tax=Capitella teleta TaxID=283909 RepID=R7V3S1_CAPTE|nr:hypothetical protein CAPTEDRAFT_203095 [Capitella teleta]|eukprot:ELU10996.1 hypothetical protein CAPTEDRAFT_203095 [Capitella teleta]
MQWLLFMGFLCVAGRSLVLAQTPDEELDEWREHNMKFLVRSLEMDEDEKDHLKEHLQDTNIDLDSLSPQELQFYYFQTHDTNDDNLLDGLELLHALEHSRMDRLNKHSTKIDVTTERGLQSWIKMTDSIIANVDRTMETDDLDGNGYLDYSEFASSRRMYALKRKGQ